MPLKRRANKVKIKHHEADGDDDRDGDKAGKPANHGQNLSAFTKSTTLSGADKGAAESAVARCDRGVDHSLRSARGGEHIEHGVRDGRATSSSHAAGRHAWAEHGDGH